MTAAAKITPEQAERLCKDAIDAITMYSTGEANAAELADLDPALLEGLALYAQLLETMLIVTAQRHAAQLTTLTGKPADGMLDVKSVRAAARTSAGAWRRSDG